MVAVARSASALDEYRAYQIWLMAQRIDCSSRSRDFVAKRRVFSQVPGVKRRIRCMFAGRSAGTYPIHSMAVQYSIG